MRVVISDRPSYSLATVVLDAGESVYAEAGAMAAMSDGIEVKAGPGPGGVMKAVMRKQLGGESFFMTRFSALVHGAWVALAPRFPGDIVEVEVTREVGLMVETGAMLAMGDGVQTNIGLGGLTQVVLHEGLTMLKLTGSGKALLSSYGAIQRFDLAAGQRIVVDTGHLVAYSEDMHERVRVGLVGDLLTAKFSGEGVAGLFTGPGTVYLQTRAEQSLKSWLFPNREQNSGHGTAGH